MQFPIVMDVPYLTFDVIGAPCSILPSSTITMDEECDAAMLLVLNESSGRYTGICEVGVLVCKCMFSYQAAKLAV